MKEPSDAYKVGYVMKRKSLNSPCPYDAGTLEAEDWNGGQADADAHAEDVASRIIDAICGGRPRSCKLPMWCRKGRYPKDVIKQIKDTE